MECGGGTGDPGEERPLILMISICLHVVCSSGLGRPAAPLALSHCSSDIVLVCSDLAHDDTLKY